MIKDHLTTWVHLLMLAIFGAVVLCWSSKTWSVKRRTKPFLSPFPFQSNGLQPTWNGDQGYCCFFSPSCLFLRKCSTLSEFILLLNSEVNGFFFGLGTGFVGCEGVDGWSRWDRMRTSQDSRTFWIPRHSHCE